jgi:hypothetical protein
LLASNMSQPMYTAFASTPGFGKSHRRPASLPAGVTWSCWNSNSDHGVDGVMDASLLTASTMRLGNDVVPATISQRCARRS